MLEISFQSVDRQRVVKCLKKTRTYKYKMKRQHVMYKLSNGRNYIHKHEKNLIF